MTEPLLLTLNEIETTDLLNVGAKALNLARLSQNKLPVLPGIVVTSTFLEAQISEQSLRPIWEGSPNITVTEDALHFLADFLKSKPLATALDTKLRRKIAEIFPSGVDTFAVRSSAVDEDGQHLSFAGLHLTELAVPRDLIPVSLTRCWASALSGAAVKYRLQNDIPIRKIKIAVLIQPMLKPDAAGVAFTLNPVSGARDELVVEAASALGDTVVQGTVTPFRYHVNRANTETPIRQKITGDAGTTLREPLTTAQLRTLASYLERIEAIMGAPQDVEWAFSKNQFYFLQSRPISAAARSAGETIQQTQTEIMAEWTRANHPDTLPELPSVLFSSVMLRTQNRGIRFFTDMGLDVNGAGAYIKLFFGRPYLNLNIIKRVLSQLGFNPMPLLAMVGYVPMRAVLNPFGVHWKTMWGARRVFLNFLRAVRHSAATLDAYRRNTDHIIQALKKIPATTDDMLVQFRFREQIYGDVIGIGLLLLSALTGLTVLVARLVAPISESPAQVFQALGTFGKNPASVRHNATLWRLSRLALAEPAVLAYLTRSIRFNDYETALSGTEFLQAFQDYLAENGFMSTYPADMGFPRYSEQAEILLQAVAGYTHLADMQHTVIERTSDDAAVQTVWRQLTGNAHGRYRLLPWRQWTALALLKSLQRIFNLRTELFEIQARAMAAIRAWDLTLAKKWVAVKLLNAPEDYFWLTMEEIEQVLATSSRNITPLQPTIAARRDAYRAFFDVDVPLVIDDAAAPNFSETGTVEEVSLEETLLGLSVSPGQVQGEISFLSDFESVEDVPRGRILVAPSTDPAYLPYFPLAAGLIVERGGMLSHGSIIAREYGLPAVSNIDARHQLHAGDRVLLDGSTGLIQVLDRAK